VSRQSKHAWLRLIRENEPQTSQGEELASSCTNEQGRSWIQHSPLPDLPPAGEFSSRADRALCNSAGECYVAKWMPSAPRDDLRKPPLGVSDENFSLKVQLQAASKNDDVMNGLISLG